MDMLTILQVNSEILRENLERIVGTDDSSFSGIDLATLIRNKYGRSYDVQLIKKVCSSYNIIFLFQMLNKIVVFRFEIEKLYNPIQSNPIYQTSP